MKPSARRGVGVSLHTKERNAHNEISISWPGCRGTQAVDASDHRD